MNGAASTELSLAGRVAVVTGGSRGIGRAIAEALAANGAAVGIAFREREAPARELEAAVGPAAGARGRPSATSRDEASVAAFFEGMPERSGPVDILVNNAGITRDAHVIFLDSARWDEVLSVNLDGGVSLRARGRAWHAAAAVGPHHQRVVAERADAACRAERAMPRRRPASKG